ncbi:DUF2341 domain-containing protein [Geoglobus acetivorans]|uniref:DUF2341 domain-containing protein n=1 Tax=Geoglobus acetivorans TaxID=565033 RepID=A0A0A7GDV9_GEOAI|nr:hypothetical protein GACE_0094 [Geoglobus acetivorans]
MSGDNSGVSPIIGFILLLQIMIIFLAFVQTTLIPDQLKKIEYDNVKSVKAEMEKFSALISSGNNAFLLVKTPEYPDYLFLLTPEPAGFSIWTEPFTVNISAEITLPNGSKLTLSKSYESSRIYVKIDNYFYPDTTFIFENTAVFQKSNGGLGIAGDQKMLSGGVNLVIVNSSINRAYNSPHEFSFRAVSSGGRFYAENITVEFESVNPDYWASAGLSVSGNKVKATIPSGFLSTIVVSDHEFKPGPKYMLKVNPFDSYTLSAGDIQELGAALLDDYLNPITGLKVNVTVSGGIGNAVPSNIETDISGVARTSFKAQNAGSGSVIFSAGSLSTSYSITVIQPQGTNASSLLQVNWLDSGGVWDAGKDGLKKTLSVRVVDSQSSPVPGVEVRFSVTNSSVIVLNTTSALTDTNGVVNVQATALSNGSVKIYAFAGDAGDVLSLDVINVTAFWLPGWSYRVPITIRENSGNSLADYQVLVTLNASFNWSNVNSDGSDIRFTDDLGNPLSYWIEEWNYGSSAKIWVRVPSIPASSTTTIYMYYGNPTTNSESSGSSTFIFFDHFDSDSSSLYTVWESWSRINPTFIWNPANSEVTSDTSNADYFLTANVNLPQSFAVEVRAYTEDDDALGALMKTASGEFYIASMRVSHYDGTGISGTEETLLKYSAPPTYYRQATLLSSIGDVVNPSNWQVAGIAYYNGYIHALYNHAKSGSYYVGIIAPEFPGLSTQANNPPAHYDWILVRKYVDPEPTVTVGSEETYGQ